MSNKTSAALIASTFVFSLTAAAGADDLSRYRAPLRMAAPFSWGGFYVGGNAGGIWDDSSFTADPGGYTLPILAFLDTVGAFTGVPGTFFIIPGTFPLPGTLAGGSGRVSSFLGGVQAGYNWQFGSAVIGVEGQVDGLKVSRAFVFVGPSQTFPGVATSVARSLTGAGSIEHDIEGSFRERLGYAWDRWLVYGTAGVAVTSVRTRGTFNYNIRLGPTLTQPPFATLTGLSSSSDTSNTFVGATFGFGAEYAISRNVTVGAEYRHTFYGRHDISFGATPTVNFATGGGPPVTQGAPVSGVFKLDTDEATARLSWLLNK